MEAESSMRDEDPQSGSIYRKKRNRPRDDTRKPEQAIKRIKACYSNDYRLQINDMITSCAPPIPGQDGPGSLHDSQMGLSYWTAAEKAAFFDGLCRHGWSDLGRVASRVATKSLLEVTAYANLLARAHDEVQDRDLSLPQSAGADSEAAAEISSECCDALELSADSLLLLEREQEAQREQARFGDRHVFSTSDPDALLSPASDLLNDGDRLLVDEASDNHVDRLEKALTLLHVPNLLEVADNIFTNGSEGGLYHLDSRECPAIYASTLLRLRESLVDMVRRLVSGSILFAMTRARASAQKRRAHAQGSSRVASTDVCAAIQALGMPVDSVQYWQSVPRRLGLSVTLRKRDDRNRRPSEDDDETLWRGGRQHMYALPYDKVEELLSPMELPDRLTEPVGGDKMSLSNNAPMRESELKQESEYGSGHESEVEPGQDYEQESEQERESEREFGPEREFEQEQQPEHEQESEQEQEPESEQEQKQEQERESGAEDSDMSVLVDNGEDGVARNGSASRTDLDDNDAAEATLEDEDQAYSAAEEYRLWSLLPESHPNHRARKGSTPERPKPHLLSEKSECRLPGWRQTLARNYHAPWETLPQQVPPEAFGDYKTTLTRDDFQGRRRRKSSSLRASSSRDSRSLPRRSTRSASRLKTRQALSDAMPLDAASDSGSDAFTPAPESDDGGGGSSDDSDEPSRGRARQRS